MDSSAYPALQDRVKVWMRYDIKRC